MLDFRDFDPIRVGDRLLPGKFSVPKWFPVTIHTTAKIPEGGDRVVIGGFILLPWDLILSWGAAGTAQCDQVLLRLPGLTLTRGNWDDDYGDDYGDCAEDFYYDA